MAAQPISKTVSPQYGEIAQILRDGTCVRGLLSARARYPHWKVNGTVPSRGDCADSYFLWACRMGHLRVAQALLELGASMVAKNNKGNTALLLACRGDTVHRLALVTWLLKQTDVLASIDDVNNFGLSALHHAGAFGIPTVLRMLLCFGPNRGTRSKKQHLTAAELVREYIGKLKDYPRLRLKDYSHLSEERAQLIESACMPPREEWRPRNASEFPLKYHSALRTLVILAKARTIEAKKNVAVVVLISHYPDAYLDRLPEELLQYLFVYIVGIPFPEEWVFS